MNTKYLYLTLFLLCTIAFWVFLLNEYSGSYGYWMIFSSGFGVMFLKKHDNDIKLRNKTKKVTIQHKIKKFLDKVFS